VIAAQRSFAVLRGSARDVRARWRRPRGVNNAIKPLPIAIGAFALFVALALAALYLDGALTLAARRLPGFVRSIFVYVTMLGDSLYIFLLSAFGIVASLLMRGKPGAARAYDAALATLAARCFFVFTVAAFSGILSQVLKRIIGRARPRMFDQFGEFHFVIPGFPSVYASFPSGHAITAFACAVALSYFVPRLRWALLTLAVLVAVSRVIVGAHYASDVIAGAAIGWLSAVLVRRAFAARGIAFKLAGGHILVKAFGKIAPALAGKSGKATL
jgi:undecaprenyl-diphosphatase